MFQGITEDDYEILKQAIAQITVLIAGADGNIDTTEVDWATKLTTIRSYAYAEKLQAFYATVGENFVDDVNDLIKELPFETEARTKELSSLLEELNGVFDKLENRIAVNLYESFLSFAEHVAKASGGFLRFASISMEEKDLICLPMIHPVILEISEDEL